LYDKATLRQLGYFAQPLEKVYRSCIGGLLGNFDWLEDVLVGNFHKLACVTVKKIGSVPVPAVI
jgi:hypothetical protein